MQVLLVYLVGYVFMVKQTFDLAQLKNRRNKMTEENPFYKMDLGYLSALMATVTGTDQQAKLAKEYLKDVDPDIWHD